MAFDKSMEGQIGPRKTGPVQPPTDRLPETTAAEKMTEQRGQGLVEFAIVMPILLLLVLGMVEFGRLMVTFSSLSTASRDAARYGASVGETPSGVPHYQDCVGIRGAVESVSFFSEPSIVITYDPDGPGGVGPVEYCQAGKLVDPIQASLGALIGVTVSANYEPLVPMAVLPTIPVTSESTRTVLRDVYIK